MVSGLERSLLELRCCPAQDVSGELNPAKGVVPEGVSPVPSTSDSKLNIPADGVWMGTPATSVDGTLVDGSMLRALVPSELVNAGATGSDVGLENLEGLEVSVDTL